MFTDSHNYFRDVPVSVTMEDDAKVEQMGPSSDTDQEQRGARILQVNIASMDSEGKEGIAGGAGASKVKTVRTEPDGSIDSDDYVLQSPSAATGDKSLEMQIQRDFDGLTESERQKVYFDVRGDIFKAEPRTESDALATPLPMIESTNKLMDSPVLESELEALNRELYLLLESSEKQENNPLYQTILKILSSSGPDFYANSAGFRSKMLRAEHKDTKKAAKRTADFLVLLCELFGEKLLSRPIRLSDLSSTDRQLQRKGYQQLFRFRDQMQHRGKDQKQLSEQQLHQQQHLHQQLQELGTGAGRRIAGSFDLCRCISTIEPAIDDETSKVCNIHTYTYHYIISFQSVSDNIIIVMICSKSINPSSHILRVSNSVLFERLGCCYISCKWHQTTKKHKHRGSCSFLCWHCVLF